MAGKENNGIMPNVHDDTIAKKNPLVTLVVVIHKSINCTAALCTGRGSRCAAMTVGIALMLYKITNLQTKPKYSGIANMQFFAAVVQFFCSGGQAKRTVNVCVCCGALKV